ncbi:guanylate cyclase activator 2B [Callospermophilus lateralis]|uniref:guanylate cyclase activator 2B n=1 Tax=Callospermophilus lateralis TaxID=76772 RepID=UPI00403867B1
MRRTLTGGPRGCQGVEESAVVCDLHREPCPGRQLTQPHHVPVCSGRPLVIIPNPLPGNQLWASVGLLLLLQSTQSVHIKYQGFEVQLESVKKLSALEGQQEPSPHLQTKSLLPSVCHHPALPQDLRPICTSQEAASIFQTLRTIANDDCELCVNVACTGC